MKRRIFCITLALALLAACLPPAALAAPAYGIFVNRTDVENCSPDETVELSYRVSGGSYNAFDLTLSYDPAYLKVEQKQFEGKAYDLSDGNGIVRMVGFGEQRSADSTLLTVTFRLLKCGQTQVRASAAKVDSRAGAIASDAPDAGCTGAVTRFFITAAFSVTLDDGLIGGEEASYGEDYYFEAENDYYDYAPSATVDGETVAVRPDGSRSWYIPGDKITGDLVIASNRTPKQYSVTVTGSGKGDVTLPGGKPTYGQDYRFSLRKDDNYQYTLRVTVDGKDVSVSDDGGSYTLPGSRITGSVVISVTKTQRQPDVYPVEKPDYVTGADQAERDVDYIFTVDREQGYDYGTPVATVGGTYVKPEKRADGSYRIPGTSIDGDVVIDVPRTPKNYRVTLNGSALGGEDTAVYGKDYSFTLTKSAGFTYTVKVTIGGKSYTGFRTSGTTYTIPGADILGDVVVTAIGTKTGTGGGTTGGGTSGGTTTVINRTDTTNTTTGSGSVNNVTFVGEGARDARGAASTTPGKDYTFSLGRKRGFDYTVTAKIGNNEIGCTYDVNTGLYTVPAKSITGTLVITVGKAAAPKVYHYLTMNQRTMYLIVFDAELDADQLPTYNGEVMYYSELYRAYAWLVISLQNEEAVQRDAALAITLEIDEDAAQRVEHIRYTGDVNDNSFLERQDSTLTQEMYNVKHDFMDVTMERFLGADLNADHRLNVMDAEAILEWIRRAEKEAAK